MFKNFMWPVIFCVGVMAGFTSLNQYVATRFGNQWQHYFQLAFYVTLLLSYMVFSWLKWMPLFLMSNLIIFSFAWGSLGRSGLSYTTWALIIIGFAVYGYFEFGYRKMLSNRWTGHWAEFLVRVSLKVYALFCRGEVRIINNVYFPNGTRLSESDHILILPEVTIVIETKGLNGKLKQLSDGTWTQNNYPMKKSPTDQVWKHVEVVHSIDSSSELTSLVVFTNGIRCNRVHDNIVFGWFFALHRAISKIRKNTTSRTVSGNVQGRYARLMEVARFGRKARIEHLNNNFEQDSYRNEHATNGNDNDTKAINGRLAAAYCGMLIVSAYYSGMNDRASSVALMAATKATAPAVIENKPTKLTAPKHHRKQVAPVTTVSAKY